MKFVAQNHSGAGMSLLFAPAVPAGPSCTSLPPSDPPRGTACVLTGRETHSDLAQSLAVVESYQFARSAMTVYRRLAADSGSPEVRA